jgi:hypothetical protein
MMIMEKKTITGPATTTIGLIRARMTIVMTRTIATVMIAMKIRMKIVA